MLFLILHIFVVLDQVSRVDLCQANTYPHCHSWSSCSRTCGGGEHSRICESCYLYQDKRFYEKCEEWCLFNHPFYGGSCHCPSWRYGECCESCRHIYIANCMPGQQSCGGTPDGIMCTQCYDPYYSAGYNQGCRECSAIDHCKHRHCTTSYNTMCLECENDRMFFQKTTGDTKCERLCSYNNHYCWPGKCGEGFTKNCQCASGFKRVSSGSETLCQPAIPPAIETCDTVTIGPNGEKKRSLSREKSTECKFLDDMYANFQPKEFNFDMMSTFIVDVSNISKPKFIAEERFGVTDTTVYIIKKDIDDAEATLSVHNQLVDTNRSQSVKDNFKSSANLSVTSALRDGQALCVLFEAKGGGYLKHIDISQDAHVVSNAIPYQKTISKRQICFRYDSTAPTHCQETSCGLEPLFVSDRITRSTLNAVTFKGWTDPYPKGGQPKQASNIESFQITVNEVIPSKTVLKVDTKIVYTKKVNATDTSLSLNLTSDKPRLYCITLEVKDVADNVRQARRFMLFDNTSFVEISKENPFRVTSASIQTSFTWQTHHHDICLSWKDRFLNKFYFDNELLNRIESEPNGLIAGVYEQNEGLLPVSGTPNVNGIIRYKLAWSVDNGTFSPDIEIPNFQNQSFCHNLNVKDGQTYTFRIRPEDVVNNTLTDYQTVHIDRSAPHINNIWLQKDGFKTLYVHHEYDLSSMQLYFEALDPHSGLKQIAWSFGISDTGSEISSGTIKVSVVTKIDPSEQTETFYCPDVGACEFFNYTVSLNKLVAEMKNKGDHNRNYYFTIKVTNNAMLSNIEHVEILVDDSPPETGVLYEGPANANDIDYTSDDTFLVNWHGFIDHESGIKVYRIGLAERCLGQKELFNSSSVAAIEHFSEVEYTVSSTRIPANFTGKRFVTIIAINNAMDPSDAVCSDGITRDISPPEVRNLTLMNARWSESLICHQGSVWLFHSFLAKIRLHDISDCSATCPFSKEHPLASALPTKEVDNADVAVSEFMCSILRDYDNDTVIYLPTDNIYIRWDIEESGSQVHDFFVGIGRDSSEYASPGVDDYKSTARKTFFKRRHEGIGSDELFFIFVKAVNKAGLEKVTTLGPVMVDETPPLSRYIPGVTLLYDNVVVGWEKDTFYDMEQKEQINSIFFRIGHEDSFVTPLLQWKLDTSEPCPHYSGGCFSYPVRRLQSQDTDLGLEFYIEMNVYNNAGHALKVTTENFKIPSLFPPGHAIVADLDPDDIDSYTDTNIHFTANTICVSWYGFKHHESVRLQIGVGSRNTTDDVIPFSTIDSTQNLCINDSRIEFNTEYFALVKATCSGGTTVASSNGVYVANETHIRQALTIHTGKQCKWVSGKEVNINFKNEEVKMSFDDKVTVGNNYMIKISNSNVTEITSEDGILVKMSTEENFVFSFFPFIESPSFLLRGRLSSSATLFLQPCSIYTKYTKNVDKFTVYWNLKDEGANKITFQVALGEKSNASFEYKTEFEKVENENNHFTFHNLNLKPEQKYSVAMKPCSKVRCLQPEFSKEFEVDNVLPFGRVLFSALTLNSESLCHNIVLQWETFKAGSNVLFYQWAVSRDSSASHILTSWRTLLSSGNSSYEVSTCILLPVHGHSTMYGCVRGFTESEQQSTVCNPLKTLSDKEYSRETVYDFDANSPVWGKVKNLLVSSNIGRMYNVLHDHELDFGTASTTPAGVMLYATERLVTWYLMTSRNVPLHCDTDINCLIEKSTSNGFVLFDKNVQLNTLLYICAYSNTTSVEREWFTETMEEILSCSNGFVLDDSPPVPGVIHVANNSGFITEKSNVLVVWDSFRDNIDAKALGYVNEIQGYTFAIGFRPDSSNIQNFTDVGLATTVTVDLSGVSIGASLFFIVTGTDMAGNTATALSSQLTLDTSPPSTGYILLENVNLYTTDKFIVSESLKLQLVHFADTESGISHFVIGIGTQPHVTDVVSLFICMEDSVEIRLNSSRLQDGHVYYVQARAVNHAGLESSFSSMKLIVDLSPPAGGHVMDGDWMAEKDADFQSDTSRMFGHWKGFSDEHSGLSYYRVGLGTAPYQDDIEPFTDVGLAEDIEWFGEFIIGYTYFITVECCNRAGLCQTRVSDGVTLDNSPPIQGLVRVGSDELHGKYQHHTSSVHVRWAGFEDPQSGIDHFDMCIGTTPGKCDILPYVNCLLQSNIILTNLSLPTETDLFAYITAYNKIDMNVSGTSDSFRVDDTPPVLIKTPKFILDYNSVSDKLGQWDISVLRLSWEFTDKESPILSHTVTLFTHHEGQTPVEHKYIGYENTFTINLDDKNLLHNGDTYFAIITGCNSAGLCSTAKSDDLLVDATPPHMGGFKPPMLWNNFNDSVGTLRAKISISWYGFHDQESNISRYYVTVSRSYSGSELTEGVAIVVPKNNGNVFHSFMLNGPLKPDDLIILSIWAENNVGLNSSVARVTVNALSVESEKDTSKMKGSLELEKHSCDIHFCNKDCTCAVIGKPCTQIETNATCLQLNASTRIVPDVKVYTGLANNPQTITASSACLTGHWVTNTTNTSLNIVRYEWSMGLKDQPVGEGIFNLKNEIPWQDVGLRNEIIYCLPVNRSLVHGQSYVIYVRAWLSSDEFATYQSRPITVDQTPPSLRRGRSVQDSNEKCAEDFDIIDWMDTITACWKGVFSEQQGIITHYTVSLGVSLNSDEILHVTNMGLGTKITLRNLSLTHGTKYFFTVTAYNNVGMHTTATSDGFVVDMDTPIAGVMFNTPRHRNKAFQSSSDSLGFSWHGFQDAVSGIRNYRIAIMEDGHKDFNSPSLTNVSLQNRYTFQNLNLKHGLTYRGTIQADDNAGHLSNMIVSEKVTIDETAPKGMRCVNFTDKLNVHETLNGTIKTLQISTTVSGDRLYTVLGRMLTNHGIPRLVLHKNRFHMELPLVKNHDGALEFEYKFLETTNRLINISLDIKSDSNVTIDSSLKECSDMVEDNKTAVWVQQISRHVIAVSIFVMDEESSLYKTEIGAGTSRGGFHIKPLTIINHKEGQGLLLADVSHGTPVHVTLIATNRAGLTSVFYAKPIIIDHTAPSMSNLSATIRTIQTNDTKQMTVIEGHWKVFDDESGVKYCFCSLGRRPDISDVQPTWLTATETSCTSDPQPLQHGDIIYLTVKCLNTVEMSTDLLSRPLPVSLLEPDVKSASISFVPLNDNCAMYTSPDDYPTLVQTNRSNVQLRWDGFVEPSGIDHFEYRLVRGQTTIVDWTSTGKKEMAALRGLHLEDGNITAEVRAVNSGLHTSKAIQSSIIVEGSAPALTGRPADVTRQGNILRFAWTGVFGTVSGVPLSYSVVAGTRLGFTDVLDLGYTSGQVIDIKVPDSTTITPHPKELFIQITCTYATGLSATYQTSYKLE